MHHKKSQVLHPHILHSHFSNLKYQAKASILTLLISLYIYNPLQMNLGDNSMILHLLPHFNSQPDKKLRVNIYPFILLLFIASSTTYAVTDCQQITEIPQEKCQTLVNVYKHTDGENWASHLN